MDELVVQRRVHYTQFTNTFRDNENVTAQEKYLYMVLCSFAGDNGYAFPSIELLAKRTSNSPSTVRRLLKSLEEKGGLYICKRYDKTTNRQLSNRYYLIDTNYYTGEFDTSLLEPLKLRFPDKIIYE